MAHSENIAPSHSVPEPGQPADEAGHYDNLYHEASTTVGGRDAPLGLSPRFYRGPKATYDRGLGQYLSQLNETAPEGEKIFDIDDWKGKTLLDIGSGGYDRFGMEARARGLRVVSLNPALQKEEARAMLRDGVVMGQRNARSAAYGEWAARDFLRRAITKPAEVPDLQSESVAALGQALPFKSGTFDGVVSVFGVPEYLHHRLFGANPDLDSAAAYVADKALIKQAFDEVVRVLKPDGKAYLKDMYGAPKLRLGDKLSPEDGGVVTDVLHELAACDYKIYINDNPSARVNQAGGVMRVIELTKRQPEQR